MISWRLSINLLAACLVASQWGNCASAASSNDLIRTVAVTGQASPGLPAGTVVDNFDWPGIDSVGRAYFMSVVQNGRLAAFAIHQETNVDALALVAVQDSELAPNPNSFLERPANLIGNGVGQIIFTAEMGYRDPPVPSNAISALWIASPQDGLKEITRSFAPAPGGGQFDDFSAIALNDAGNFAFYASVRGGASRNGIWSTTENQSLDLLAQTGQLADGLGPGEHFGYTIRYPMLNDVDETYFVAQLAGGRYGILRHQPATGFTATRDGDPAPGAGDGVVFEIPHYQKFEIGSRGGLGYLAQVTGDGINEANRWGIWSGTSMESVACATRQNQFVPGSHSKRFETFLDPKVNSRGLAAFIAWTTEGELDPTTGRALGARSESLWKQDSSGELVTVAEVGQQAPGLSDEITFSSFITSWTDLTEYAINDVGQVAFLAQLQGPGLTLQNGLSLWVEDRNGGLQLVAMPGMSIDVDDGPGIDHREIASFFTNSQFQNSFNDQGQVVFIAEFVDGSRGVFVSNAGAIPEPNSMCLIATSSCAAMLLRNRSAMRPRSTCRSAG